MKYKVVLMLAVMALTLFVARGEECVYAQETVYWEEFILENAGRWIPPVFDWDGSTLACVDPSAIDEYFTAKPSMIQASCGGGCSVDYHGWAVAYEEYKELFA